MPELDGWPDCDGVVFDLDGVLIESLGLWRTCQREAAEALGYTWQPSFEESLRGKDQEAASRAIVGAAGAADRFAALRQEIVRRAVARAPEVVVPVEHSPRLVRSLTSAGVPMAVATNAPRAFADACLHHIGLASAMSAVVSCDDVSLPKPAPDVYLRAADLLGLPPQRCVAIEDSDVGLRAARTAGLVTIGVGPAVVGVRGVAHHVGTIEGLAELRALRGSRTG